MAIMTEDVCSIGYEYGKMTADVARQIVEASSEYFEQAVGVRDNRDDEGYELVKMPPTDEAGMTGMLAYWVPGTSANGNDDGHVVYTTLMTQAAAPVIHVGNGLPYVPAAGGNGNANHGSIATHGTASDAVSAMTGPSNAVREPRAVRQRRPNNVRARRAGHIPRPRDSWIIYRSDKTRMLRDRDPTLTPSVISRIVAQLWANEDPAIKDSYRQMAQEETDNHLATHPGYRYRARRPVSQHPTVDAHNFWQNLPNNDTENDDPEFQGTRAMEFIVPE